MTKSLPCSIMESPAVHAVVTTLIIEDAAVVASRLAEFLAEDAAVRLVGIAADGERGLALFEAHRPDLVILDLDLPIIDGMEVLDRIKRLRPESIVVIFTQHSAEEIRRLCLERGADGFINKADGFKEVSRILEAVAAKKRMRNTHAEGCS